MAAPRPQWGLRARQEDARKKKVAEKVGHILSAKLRPHEWKSACFGGVLYNPSGEPHTHLPGYPSKLFLVFDLELPCCACLCLQVRSPERICSFVFKCVCA